MKKINELRDYLLENYVDEVGDLYIPGLDFSNLDGDVYTGGMKVKGDLYQSQHEVEGTLYQSYHKVKGSLIQDKHEVKGDLYQGEHEVGGNLFQSGHEVDGNYYSTSINVTGKIKFEEPKKLLKEITLEELAEMGYTLKGE